MKIFVSSRAGQNHTAILTYLRKDWSEQVVLAFIQKTKETLELIEKFPEIGVVDVPEKTDQRISNDQTNKVDLPY